MSERNAPRERRDDIAFFGAVTAGLSHELKNVLATINELSGLQDDLLLMAKRGRPLDERRFEKIGAKIRLQVGRGEQLLGALNRFAHSVDQPEVTVDLAALFEVTMALCQRAARLKCAQLVPRVADGLGDVTLSPFGFHRLIIQALEAVLQGATQGEPVSVALDRTPGECRVVIEGHGGPEHAGIPPGLEVAAQVVGARLELECVGAEHRLVISLPDGNRQQKAIQRQGC